MNRMPDRQRDPSAAFEWFEFHGDLTEDEKSAALAAIARGIAEEEESCSAPAWSGLVSPDEAGTTGRWGLTTPGRQAPVPAWLKRPSPHQRP